MWPRWNRLLQASRQQRRTRRSIARPSALGQRFCLELLELRAAPAVDLLSISDPSLRDNFGNGASEAPSISGDGRFIAFQSYADNLVAGDTNGKLDIYRKDLDTGIIILVSSDGSGTQGNNESQKPSISNDGRYIAFQSSASNLVAGDTNGTWDVFRKDMMSGAIVRVSTDGSGAQVSSFSTFPAISSNGRFIAFQSDANNLVAGDTAGTDTFRKDLDTGAIVRASTNASGTQGGSSSNYAPSIGADGRYVAFQSQSNNLVVGDTNNTIDVFRKDLTTGAIVRVSTDGTGAQANNYSQNTSISGDGRFVAFWSIATNLVSGDTNGAIDIFRKDLDTGAIVRASTDGAGSQGNSSSENLSISGDGRYVVFRSSASNLVAGDTNGAYDVFRKDLNTGAIVRVSVGATGSQANGYSDMPSISSDGNYVAFQTTASNLVVGGAANQIYRKNLDNGLVILATRNEDVDYVSSTGNNASYLPVVSSDGRFVAFESYASNLVAADTNGTSDIFRKDLLTGAIVLVSTNGSGTQGNSSSLKPAISSDGRYVAFESYASNLVAADTNGTSDIFRKDLNTGTIVRVSSNASGVEANDYSGESSISSNGRYVAFRSDATNLVASDNNGMGDIFRKDLNSGAIVRVSTSGTGTQANSFSERPAISGDGRYIAFQSEATNLVTVDTNGFADVFRKDLNSNATVCVSSDASGVQGISVSAESSISSDGRYVAFQSWSNNLVPGDTNGTDDVFRKDLNTGAIIRASTDGSGGQGAGGGLQPSISGDGRYVAFYSNSSTLVAGDTNATYDAFRKDLNTNAIDRVSTDGLGTQVNSGGSKPSISGNGGYVAFESSADNLVSADRNNTVDIFLKDTTTGQLQLASNGPGIVGNLDSRSFLQAVSDDGRCIAFQSFATNLVVGDINGFGDIFVRDRQTGTTSCVSTDSSGNQANADCTWPAISGDGRFVTFESVASNLVSGDTNGVSDVFRKDLLTGSIVRVSTDASGTQGNGYSGGSSISDDGRYVAFYSDASNLLAGDTNGAVDIFRKDLDTGAMLKVSADGAGVFGNSDSSVPSISGDGRFVAFYSWASNLVVGDTNVMMDIFRKDLVTAAIVRVSTDGTGLQGNNDSAESSISSDGRFVAFSSFSDNLVAGDTNGSWDVFRKDLDTGAIVRVGTDTLGVQGSSDSLGPSISSDGQYVAFQSRSVNLIAGDANGAFDVFRKEMATGAVVLISITGSGTQGNRESVEPSISGDGSYIVFRSFASNLVDYDLNATYDLFGSFSAVNGAPTDLSLSNVSVAENQPVNTVVGNLATTDPNVGNTFNYTLVTGAGDTGNASFAIVGNQLKAASSFNFESQASYSVRIRTTDQGGLWFERSFTVAVTNVNEAPTDVELSNANISEHQPIGTVVGNLTTTDPDVGNTFTYSFATGAGDTSNASFTIVGDQLQAAVSFDFLTQASYSVRLRTTDQGGLWFEKAFIITVTDVNAAPTDVALSNESIDENQPNGTTIGDFSATDPDVGDYFAYTLVVGAGDANNASFAIAGDQLKTAASFNFEAQSTYSVRIRTTDQGGLWFERAFTITILDVNEAPTNLTLSNASIAEQLPDGTAIGDFTTADPDADNIFTYAFVEGAGDNDNASFNMVGNQLKSRIPHDFETQSSFSIRVRTTDQGGLWFERSFIILVTDVNEAPTDFVLSNSYIDENAVIGMTIGAFSTIDPDSGDTFAYTIVAGAGDDGNFAFTIVGNQLKAAANFDYESRYSYNVRVRTTDQGGFWLENAFSITVLDVNEAPTDLVLSNSVIAENLIVGTVVGLFESTDQDTGSAFTYTFVNGVGDANNAAFAIEGNELQTGANFDFETQSSYSIRVRTNDQGGLYFERSFTITVTNVNEAPTAVFTPSRTSGRAALLVDFDATASFDIDASSGDSIVEYVWDWEGDGTYDFTTTSPLVSHRFYQAGVFPVRLVVVDAAGLSHLSQPQAVTVDPASVTWVYNAARDTLTITGAEFSEAIVLTKDTATGRIHIGGDIDELTTAPVAATLKIVISANGGDDTIDLSGLAAGFYANGMIDAGDGADTVVGGAAADSINGGRGHDRITGNGGADRFQFDHLDPAAIDAVMDFQQGVDKIDLSAHLSTLDYSQLRIAQDGTDTVIVLRNGQTIRLKNFNRKSLSAKDFIFRRRLPGLGEP